LAASKACPAENTKVTFVLIPLSEKYLAAILLLGNLTTICSCKSANSSPLNHSVIVKRIYLGTNITINKVTNIYIMFQNAVFPVMPSLPSTKDLL
jgi:hypothetical protein